MTAARLGASFDLLAAWQDGGVFLDRDGVGVATGPGERVGVEDVTAALGEWQPGAIAAGALPFAGGGELVIGEDQVRRTDPFVTTKIGEGSATLVTGVIPAAAFSETAVTPVPAPALYAGAVEDAVRRIRAGAVRKVVLARTIEVAADRTFDARRLAHRLRAVDPHAFSFIAPTDRGTLVGASPELLVSRQGTEVRANPLAGSAPRSGDKEQDRANAETLAASAKNLEEHAIVVDAIVAALQPLCATLTWDQEPVLLETANVWHLSTRFRGRLAEPAPSALDLALALHPTPAIAGMPTDAALETIAQLEGFPRGSYTGPVGWVDADGNGVWAIALRCAVLSADRATLYAGAGIVEASDPADEVHETDRKFRAFLDALRWG